jgi:hypothetical protein
MGALFDSGEIELEQILVRPEDVRRKVLENPLQSRIKRLVG